MIENSITEGTRLIVRDINDEMESAFIDYSMSVITQRALPDVRDGLKPVHRRILYTMHERGNDPSHPTRKSADTVGAVLGSYHPARRRLCVRRHGAPGAGFFHALPSGGRAGQLWLCGR